MSLVEDYKNNNKTKMTIKTIINKEFVQKEHFETEFMKLKAILHYMTTKNPSKYWIGL